MSRRFPLSLLSVLLGGASVLPGVAHATNGYFTHGYGVKSEGMAGTGIALPQDALTGATNPAGTAWVGDRLDAGLNLFLPSRGASIEGNGAGLDGDYSGNGRKTFFIPEFGLTRQLDERLSLGLAVYGNGGMNTQYDRSPFAAFGETGHTGVNLEQLFISPSVAYRLTEDHAVSVALNLAYQRFSAEGLSPFTTASEAPTQVSGQGNDSSLGAGVRLGWIGQLSPGWRLGATWSSKIHGRFDKYRGLFADQGSFDIPANYGVGLAYQPGSDWTLALDYQVIQYSGVKSVGTPLAPLLAGQPLGADGGAGFGWKDVHVVKLGAAYQWSPAVTLRAGYSHASEPVPQSQTFFNILAPGVVQDHATLGLSWKAGARSEWSAFYGRALKKTVHGQGSIPASFGGGEANVHLSEDVVGLSWGWLY
ncbi:OmpP1/FadL family transporter [Ideonella sp. B508-1]|uniref:OmpP1/FadL family transporter n=1 Tax=Ideonella sp. B508-1 TaxID=137716 RepID=UPI00034C6EED|nr:outer membrane protein transport protein [Ideonella sp. B508-1]